MSNQEKEIKNFVFNYTDGTSKTVEKGFFCHIKDEPNGESTLSFELAGVSGKDLTQIVLGALSWAHAWECSTKRKVRK